MEDAPRVLEIQVTRACDLACVHCATAGAPGIPEGLPLRLLLAAIDDGSAAGYETLRLSGGEPTLYPGLGMLLERAADVGMERHLETHGCSLDAACLADLVGRVEALTIGLDGAPARHDAIRGDGAFFDMASNLPALGASAIPFGFRFTVRRDNVADIAWVARFAADVGAGWLVVQRLQRTGRAVHLVDQTLDELAVLRLRVLCAEVARDLRGRLTLQWHLDPPRVRTARGRCLAEVVPVLTILPDGDVRPAGWSDGAALGNLHHADLPILVSRWRRGRLGGVSARSA